MLDLKSSRKKKSSGSINVQLRSIDQVQAIDLAIANAAGDIQQSDLGQSALAEDSGINQVLNTVSGPPENFLTMLGKVASKLDTLLEVVDTVSKVTILHVVKISFCNTLDRSTHMLPWLGRSHLHFTR